MRRFLRAVSRSFRLAVAGLAGSCLALAAFTLPAQSQPQRILSINACTDQLLFKLAPAHRIAALSIYAADPTLSIYAEEVRASGIPLITGSVEEVLKLKPDLVVAGTWTRRITRERLRADGIRLEEFGAPVSIADVKAGIARMADLLGEEARGEAMLAEIDAAVRSAGQKGVGGVTALQFQRRGYTSGDATLIGDLLEKAGIGNAAKRLGVSSVGRTALETVLKERADLLILLDADPRAADQGTALLAHPALREAYPPERRVVLPNNLTVCGGPAITGALTQLSAALSRLPRRR